MKQLADGSFVADSVTTKNIGGLRYLLTPEEIVGKNANEAEETENKRKRVKLETRQAALAAKWKDPFDLIDDILERGIDTVKTERDAVKTANPKP